GADNDQVILDGAHAIVSRELVERGWGEWYADAAGVGHNRRLPYRGGTRTAALRENDGLGRGQDRVWHNFGKECRRSPGSPASGGLDATEPIRTTRRLNVEL